jgi:hypothetical protein
VHSCQPVTSYQSLLIVKFCHAPSTRISEWLPQIAHFTIFVLTHKNANEPARVLPLWQDPGRTLATAVLSVMEDVIGFYGMLLVLCVMANVILLLLLHPA